MPRYVPLGELLQVFAPVICRLLARKPGARGFAGRPLTDEEIAERSGLDLPTIKYLAEQHSWDHIPVEQMVAFTRGCGLDFDDRAALKKHLRYLGRRETDPPPTWDYLRRSPDWASRWQPLILRHTEWCARKYQYSVHA